MLVKLTPGGALFNSSTKKRLKKESFLTIPQFITCSLFGWKKVSRKFAKPNENIFDYYILSLFS